MHSEIGIDPVDSFDHAGARTLRCFGEGQKNPIVEVDVEEVVSNLQLGETFGCGRKPKAWTSLQSLDEFRGQFLVVEVFIQDNGPLERVHVLPSNDDPNGVQTRHQASGDHQVAFAGCHRFWGDVVLVGDVVRFGSEAILDRRDAPFDASVDSSNDDEQYDDDANHNADPHSHFFGKWRGWLKLSLEDFGCHLTGFVKFFVKIRRNFHFVVFLLLVGRKVEFVMKGKKRKRKSIKLNPRKMIKGT